VAPGVFLTRSGPGYTVGMDSADPASGRNIPAALLFVVLAVLVSWLSRDVLPMDVWLRFLLALLWAASFALASLGAGRSLVRLLAPARENFLPLSMLTGAAVLALLACIAAWVGCLDPWILRCVFGLAAVAGLFGLRGRTADLYFLPEGLVSPAGALLLLPACLSFVVVTTPPVMYDVLHYHLAFPAQWLLSGGFVEFPRESFSYYPSAGGMLYAYALVLPGAWGGSAINWLFVLLASLCAGELGRHIGGPAATPWAVAVFALTPAILETSAYASADLVVAGWAGAALLLLARRDDLSSRELLLAGFLAGSAAAAKYLALALVVFPLLCSLPFVLHDRFRRRIAGALAMLGLGLLVSLGPWLARNALWTGNPVYPYMQKILGGPPCPLDLQREVGRTSDRQDALPLRMLRSSTAFAWRCVFPRREGGLPGVHWPILLGVAAMLFPPSRKRRWLWVYVLTGLMTWGFLVHYFRFLSPVLVGAAALAGAALPALRRGKTAFVSGLMAVFFVFVFGWNLSILASPLEVDRMRVISGQLPEKAFRAAWDDRSPAVDFVREHLPGNALILLVGECRSFGLDRRVIVDGPYRSSILEVIAEESRSPGGMAAALRKMGVTHLLINRREMRRLAGIRRVEDFWDPASPVVRRRITSFLSVFVEPLFQDRGLGVFRLRQAARTDLPEKESSTTAAEY